MSPKQASFVSYSNCHSAMIESDHSYALHCFLSCLTLRTRSSKVYSGWDEEPWSKAGWENSDAWNEAVHTSIRSSECVNQALAVLLKSFWCGGSSFRLSSYFCYSKIHLHAHAWSKSLWACAPALPEHTPHAPNRQSRIYPMSCPVEAGMAVLDPVLRPKTWLDMQPSWPVPLVWWVVCSILWGSFLNTITPQQFQQPT